MSLEKVSERQLRFWFNRLNRLAFGSKLKVDYLEFGHSDDWVAVTNKNLAKGTFSIRISNRIRFSLSLVITSLVHEMVHVENWKLSHGRKFGQRIIKAYKKARLEQYL